MSRLPQPGGDANHWGDVLNDYLRQAHTDAGLLKENSVNTSNVVNNAISEGKLAAAVRDKLNGALPANGTAVAAQKLATPRMINLAGDVSGGASFDGSADTTINVQIPTLDNRVTLMSTGDNSELVASVPITPTSPPKQVIYSLELPDLHIGDYLVVTCDMQVTNPYTYNALYATQLILGDTATAVNGTEISEAAGTNVTPSMHHMQVSRTGMIAPTNTSRRFVNVVGYSAASNAGPGDMLTIDADYGRLNVLRIKAGAVLPEPDGPTWPVLAAGASADEARAAIDAIGPNDTVNTANKIATPRTIALSGAVSGSAAFDGSSDITITTTGAASATSYSMKAADQTVTNTTVLTPDSELIIPVLANTTYELTAFFIYNSSTTADFKFQFGAPAGSTLNWNNGSIASTATGSTSTMQSILQALGNAATTGGTGGDATCRPYGILSTGPSAGNLTLSFAQGTTDNSNTILRAKSFMKLTKIS